MIIDCHCHAGKGDGLTGPWDTDAPLGRYLRRAAKVGIERTVLFAAFHSDYAVANREVARMVLARPGRFYGFAFIHAERDRGRVQRMVRDRGGGVRVPSASRCTATTRGISREICEAAAAVPAAGALRRHGSGVARSSCWPPSIPT